MYLRYWQLQQDPFPEIGEVGEPFDSPTHEEALARLEYVVEHRKRLAMLVGPSGVGKSTLLGHFARRVKRRGWPVVQLSLLAVDDREFLETLVQRLAGYPYAWSGSAASWRQLGDQLAAIAYQQLSTVILLDDVDQAGSIVLASVRRLVQWDLGRENRLSMVLSSGSSSRASGDRSLYDLVELRIELEPWDRWQTARFLNQALERAGARQPLFDGPALKSVYELSGGRARRVVQLAQLALLAGAGASAPVVDERLVWAAYQQLTLQPAELSPVG